ncbi:hypothetical protein VTK26DRAFT_3625 [Humicola hyalothermophila]
MQSSVGLLLPLLPSSASSLCALLQMAVQIHPLRRSAPRLAPSIPPWIGLAPPLTTTQTYRNPRPVPCVAAGSVG